MSILACILFLFTGQSISQELDCKVAINVENIPSGDRDNLRSFESDVTRYLNNIQFTREDLDGDKITCNFEIFFKSVLNENRYQAQIVITSQRPVYRNTKTGSVKSGRLTPVLRISDANWEFAYVPNQILKHDEMVFDPLVSFLDFYAYLIIGYDIETYEPKKGSDCFQKALRVVQSAIVTSVAKDWQASSTSYSKFGITDELSNIKFESFRFAFSNYFFEGLDLLATEEQQGLENILKSLSAINDVRRQNQTSIIIKQFFDAKYREIAEIFQSYPDRNVYEKLSEYDQEHRSTYQEWMIK
jgi:hypothetical protein